MSKKFIVALGVVAGFVIFWLLIENDKKNKKIKELKREIDQNENLNEEIKKRLRELIQNNQEVDPHVANELSQIAALIEIKQDTTAILKMAKIIEKLLKELYQGNDTLKELAKKKGRKTPVLADYLEFAKNEKLINDEDYHLLSMMRLIRNDEAHEVDVKKEKSRLIAAFICAAGFILALSRILKKKKIEPDL